MFRKFKKLIICLLLIICIGMIAIPVLAEPNFGFEYATATKLGTRDLKAVITQVVNILLGFLGIVAIVIILYGGYLYMTSGGAADKVERAKKILINGAIGLGIILSSYAIAFFIISALTRSTGGNEGECGNAQCGAGETCSNCPQDCDCPPPPPGGKNFAVSWVDPKRAETDVSLCRLVQIKFNNKIDPDTIDNNSDTWAGSFIIDTATVKNSVNLLVEINKGSPSGSECATNEGCASNVCSSESCQGDLVPGVITMWQDGRGITFNNTNDFEINTTYKITIKSDALATSGLENINGNRLTSGDYTWTFTTGQTTDVIPPKVLEVFPLNSAIDVCRASVVEAIFSEPMDVSSLLSTDVGSPMDANSNNSIYINPNINGFDKSVPDSNALIANPKELYTASANYAPVLDSDVIRDSCGNYLDGDADGASEFSAGGDDYAPLPVGTDPDWSFTTGNIEKCVPEIISIIPSADYYNDESAQNADLLTINGNYFTVVGSLIFNNNAEVSSAVNSCIDPTLDANYIPNQQCLTSWSDHKIEVRVPAQGGVSNGAISGNITVEVGANISNAMPFTVASPHIDSILPKEGGIEQFVTISGTGFGAAKGENDHVYFRRDEDGDTNIEVAVPAELVEANYPCAGNVGWTDKQIIIAVPDNGSFANGEDWYIQVVRDQTTNKYWGNLGDFKFKDVVPGPGICSVLNTEADSDYFNLAEGILDDTFQLSGVRFQDINLPVEQEVNFGNYTSSVSAKNIVNWVYAPPDTVDADAPNISEGKVGVYLKIDGKNSNTLNFIIHPTDAGPKINYFDPILGAIGEYVTIYGNDFAAWDGGIAKNGKSNVQFFNGGGEWINGNFDFPESCGNNFWSDTQIVVKVPAGAATGNIKVITRDLLTDDTSDLSPSNFTVTAGPAGPGICNIKPKSGPLGTSVDIFGERFAGADKIIFFNKKDGLSFNLINDEKASAVVPNKTTSAVNDDGVSGPIIIVDDKNNDGDHNDVGEKSNGYDFAVSDCREVAGGCAAISYPSYECCYDGSCMDPAAGGCDNPKEATYAWDFSTGSITTCGGYGGNQCLASASCPNSPGQCSPSPAATVDTGYNCGDNYCNTNFSTVCANQCVFSNNSCIRATACDIEKKVSEIIVGSNISGVARCNNTVSKKKYYWQTDVPCQSGTYLDINGKCTLGSASAPKSCNPNCANNFNCVNLGGTGGACVKQNICPSGSICDINTVGSDNYNACKKDLPSKCECCCRVDHSDTDCCVGLTCADADCGVDNTADIYGLCKGCAVWENITNNTPPWTFFPTLSDDKCGCQNSNRICIVDEKLVSPARDTGSCGDCANINDIDFDSDGDRTFDKIKDIKHECQTHSGSCCWNSLVNSCYTCDALEVIEESCPPEDFSSPSPQKNKTDACLNSAIYLKFNLELKPETLEGGFRIYKCAAGDRNCASTSFVKGILNLIGFHNELIFTPDDNLTPDTWHKVIINQDLKDLNDLNLSSNYEWYFKTKNEAKLCAIDTINVTPKDAIITKVNDTKNYNAIPAGDCTVLNPSSYNWSWQSLDTNIATITNNDTAPADNLIDPNQIAAALDKDGSTKIIASILTELKQGETTLFVLLESPKVVDYWPNCKEACLNASVGAKFNMAIDTNTTIASNIKLYEWHCGNGEIEIGEDCDDGGVKNGDGCSANCLNEGSNSKTSICGNGTIELGEGCDGNPLPQGCDMNKCIHTGSVANLSICGDRKIAEGEDCDDGNAISRDGCSGVATTSVDICNENTAQTQCENKDIDCFWDGAICQNFTVATSKIKCQDANGFWNGATCDGNRGCLNEGTDELINIFLGTISPNEVNNTIDINLPVGTYFQPNINYRVFLSNNIRGSLGKKQLTDLNWDFNKGNTNDSFSWSFKTKSDFCSPDKVQVAPEQKVIYNINATQDYTASIYGSPDSCNPKGQKLNPYFYNWSWTSENENVATITQNNLWPSCGNKKIETGEDCDDGGVKNGDGCSANCLNEGSNSKTSICGNGTIELGEECDGNPFPQGCDLNTCLHTGSLGVCGNGAIETGEDCDDHNTTNGDGCSSVCLNEGTQGDNYKDFYQIATTKSPGTTNITASVNYCSGDPLTTCGGTLTTTCPTGSNCKQTTGKSELEVVCGFSNDDDCNLPATTKTCNFENSGHICPITTWGGECSTSKKLCYSQNDCSDSETCQAYTDCNYCKNNTSFECRAANNFISGTGNYDCQLGVGSDSCCYSRPIIKSKSPDPSFFNSNSINCVDNFCSAFSAAGTAVCQTYTCQNINTNQGTCSAYGKCKKENTFGGYCLSNNDCPSDSTCDKSCANNSDCNDIVCGACRNAQINITFDKLMDPSSFTNNGVCSNNSSKSCDQDSNCPDGICLKNIRLGVKYDDAAINQKNCPSGYYAENNLVYQPPKTFIAKLAAKIKIWFNKLFGQKETIAAEYWCAIPGTITSFDSNNRTTAVFAPQGLKDNLFEDGVTYRVTVKHNVKRQEGVSMGKDDSGDFQYEFTAGDTECQVESVDVYVGS